MSKNSKIEWTQATWNPVTGCTKISPGCVNCYAERLAHRLKRMHQANYANGFQVALHENMIERPLKWKKPLHVFVNSMSDLFHQQVPDDFILRVFEVMKRAPWHRFQVLTKRSERLLKMNAVLPWAPNIWMGVTVENQNCIERIAHLRQIGSSVKFVSMEPLLGPMNDLDLTDIGWVIVGGESGPGARLMKKDWVIGIRDACVTNHVPFFFKQWSGINKKRAGRLLDGQLWSQMPEIPPHQNDQPSA